ncbi:MAG TPA: TIGR03435 family protein [Acidobacteriaceae bacterium]|jgi:uncharacterized protein (TIGR03435 family)|nr:TIGR03435 family protein [Acidobacteriaceae bacterium]
MGGTKLSQSPICVSGIPGADLKARIVRATTVPVSPRLDLRRKILPLAAVLMAIAGPIVFGQINAAASQSGNAPAKPLKFDVVSVKPYQTNCPFGSGIIPSADGFSNTCASLHLLIRYAYGINADDRIVGEPDWAKTAPYYGIEAKVDPADVAAVQQDRHQLVLMLQSVLEDRFQLKVHHETRELPVYALVIAKGGSKLKEGAAGDAADPPPVPVGTKDVPGLMLMRKRGKIQAWHSPVSNLLSFLSPELGRSVVDQTGLTGNYNFALQWTPEMQNGAAAAEDSGPSLFTALQEQLGLRLESTTAPMDVLVIDHVERPSPN